MIRAIVILLVLVAGQVRAQELPLVDGVVHRGVASCAGTTCHSRQIATGTTVRQNEMIIWQDPASASGAHSRGYTVLAGERSQTIARNLGIADPQAAQECLACHADAIPPELRGQEFVLADGVGCESCHGGAQDWLAAHYAPNASHADNIELGLYPTDDPVKRAQLCLSCHLGSTEDGQFVSHRVMGAGHPRLSFDLNLFTALQQHHDEDAEYGQRKAIAGGVRVWAIGQAVALRQSLTLLANPELGVDGAFPELVFYDCHSCHRPISDSAAFEPSWRPNPGRPLGPGVARLNDANLLMTLAAARVVAPDLADRLDAGGRALHAATLQSRAAQVAAAQALVGTIDALVPVLAATAPGPDQTRALLDAIVTGSLAGRYTDYAGAEQAVIAVDALLRAMVAAGWTSAETVEGLQPAIDRAYAATADANRYAADGFRAALREVAASVRGL